ncbi:DUF1827 family protein [Enterococcus xiangfangensis]|uniref:DUF1827 family protein n=1 Tax=Enterococcus xiangfangensis TaxID=1296537 RepID=A0ABU3F713_9ENTE|nr:DUF1827 family protein [Enterococcus xiangfangensis]MBM7710684.1 hypothetical protein [Enterococcus xiangfangensis]MDT2758444.1 DUF1827 family protein [Enterococcus xiangfangensis]NBK08995.1 DUF1827 family protein [Enterococcus asini]
MKLIETPLNSNVNLETLYPNLTKYFFDNRQAVKLLKLYAYDRTKIIYVDRFDTIDLLLLNRQRKISHQEVDTIIRRVLKVERKDVTVNVGYKKQILEAGLRPKESYKDIIAVEYKISK